MSTTPDNDWFEPIRREVWPQLHPILQRYGGYAVGHTGANQYVGKVEIGEEQFEEVLKDCGFGRNWVAALKTRETEYAGEQISEGSWAYRRWFFDPYQIHVTFYSYDGFIYIYAHKEYNWQRYPLKHLRTEYFETGPAKQFVKSKLSEQNIEIRKDE